MTTHSRDTIRVYSPDHDGNIQPIEQNWILKPIIDDWNLVPYDPDNDPKNQGPDLIITQPISDRPHSYANCKEYRRKWGVTPFILATTIESMNCGVNIADYTFSYHPDSDSNYYFPRPLIFVPYNLFHHNGRMMELDSLPLNIPLEQRPTAEQETTETDLIKNSFPKKRFCNFVFNNNRRWQRGARIRRKFAKRLAEYKRVDCAGKVLNNTQELIRQRQGSHFDYNWVGEKLQYIAQYKFTIAFENESQPFYLTEKLLHPLMVGSIPIYWGCPEATRFFNPACFINCHDYDSFDEVIHRVKQIDNDPTLYQQYLNAPKILPDSLLYNWTHDKVKNKLDLLMQRIVERKQASKKASYWQHKINITRFRLRNSKTEIRAVIKPLAVPILKWLRMM